MASAPTKTKTLYEYCDTGICAGGYWPGLGGAVDRHPLYPLYVRLIPE